MKQQSISNDRRIEILKDWREFDFGSLKQISHDFLRLDSPFDQIDSNGFQGLDN